MAAPRYESVAETFAGRARFRQITTAVADGTIAALAAQKHVKEHRR